MDRRGLLQMMAASGAMAVAPRANAAKAPDFKWAEPEIAKRHDESIKRIQDWIGKPAIAAENRGFPEGPNYMADLLKGRRLPVRGHRADRRQRAGSSASTTWARRGRSAMYFMYDVKQFDPKEWSSPPLEARLVDKPGSASASSGAAPPTRRARRRRSSPPCTRSAARTGSCR
jgi:hypothetical protein